MIRPMSHRGITTIMFDVHLVEQNFPAANCTDLKPEAHQRGDSH
jgi:hypothetical protein